MLTCITVTAGTLYIDTHNIRVVEDSNNMIVVI